MGEREIAIQIICTIGPASWPREVRTDDPDERRRLTFAHSD